MIPILGGDTCSRSPSLWSSLYPYLIKRVKLLRKFSFWSWFPNCFPSDFLKKWVDSSIPFIFQFPIYLGFGWKLIFFFYSIHLSITIYLGFGWKLVFFLIELEEVEVKLGEDFKNVPKDEGMQLMEVKKATILDAYIKRRKKKTNEEGRKIMSLPNESRTLTKAFSGSFSFSLDFIFSKSQTTAFFYIQFVYSSCTYCGMLFFLIILVKICDNMDDFMWSHVPYDFKLFLCSFIINID